MKHRCTICEYVYDEEAEGTPFKDLPDDRGYLKKC